MSTDFPEAPSSVTYTLVTPNGFNVLFTLRDEAGTTLLSKMQMLEERLIKDGYKPQGGYSGAKKTATKTDGLDAAVSFCPIHQTQMKERDGKDRYGNLGAKFYSHARKLGDSWDYCSGKGFKSEETKEDMNF